MSGIPQEHMKWGAHLMAPGLVVVEGMFVREIMLLLDGISVGGQITREREREREREGHPCNVCDKAVKFCKCLASTKYCSTMAMCLPAMVLARSSTPPTASTDTISLCMASLTTGRVFATSPCGGDHPQSEHVVGGGEEEDGSGQLQEEGRHPSPSQMKIDCVGF